jgi:hypothetical protein
VQGAVNYITSVAGVERMRIDSSGNVGIGTTGPATKLQIQQTTGTSGFETGFSLTNAVDSNLFIQISGSANADKRALISTSTVTPIAFATNSAERMRIDSSGNVGIGTSSPSTKLDVRGIAQFLSGSAGSFNFIDVGRTSSEARVAVAATAGDFITGTAAGDAVFYNPTASKAWFGVAGAEAAIFITNSTERMRIDSSGNVGIGTTTASAKLTVIGSASKLYVDLSGDNYYDAANHIFRNFAGTERMRIDSSGNLLVGATATTAYFDGKLNVAGYSCFKVTASATPTLLSWNNATSGNNEFVSFFTETAATNRGGINYNRTAGLVAYNTTSDYRAKDILGPVTDAGATIDALKIYNGKMKGATVSRPMLIAHEAQEVTPYAVTGEKDAVNEDGVPKFQQMDVSSLVPLLIAEIQSLRARVAQLEGN